MLNQVVHSILESEDELRLKFDAILMQDAEDLIHPYILKLLNSKLNLHDFIQFPVFALSEEQRGLVSGTYMDEFAESHTKDMLVRNYLSAAIPSAGVGTVLSRQIINSLLKKNGRVYNESSLTEDYELGIEAHAMGCSTHFACNFYIDPKTGEPNYIATREFFPKHFTRSIRQKTRWAVGIVLQGWRNLGWKGGMINRYFLIRDRKGLVTNIATFMGYPILLMLLGVWFFGGGTLEKEWWVDHWVKYLLFGNIFLMANRFIQRTLCSYRIYGLKGSLAVLPRWPIGCVINGLAMVNAIRQDLTALIRNKELAWVKTEHELPAFFGNQTETA